MNLKNKKILITGATGGIGKCIVEKFSNLDSVILATGTNEEKLENLKKKFPKIHTEKFKLDEHKKIEEFIEEIDKFDCILMIDVMHHLQKEIQEILFRNIITSMKKNSLFIYKDISNRNRSFGKYLFVTMQL